MFLHQLDLTTALRPSLYDNESLLFVQDGIGLYEGKYKIPNYQNGHAYLTTHRVCYVDNDEPRKYSISINLKDIDSTDFYAGFLKSSPKITLFPKVSKANQAISSPQPVYASPNDAHIGGGSNSPRSFQHSPASSRDANATWVCPICGLPNSVPANFDASTANQYTTLSPCQACGIKPPLALMLKSAIAAMSNRTTGVTSATPSESTSISVGAGVSGHLAPSPNSSIECPRCTFRNHPSLSGCEVCGALLQAGSDRRSQLVGEVSKRSDSPELGLNGDSIIGNENIETIKFSFRHGGVQTFVERLKSALVQRKWLLQSAPPVPRSAARSTQSASAYSAPGRSAPNNVPPRVVGIAGLEQRGAELRQNNQSVIGSAFEDLEALMTSAKEVIQMAEQFAGTQSSFENDAEARRIISDSASALGLVTTKAMLGSGSAAEQTYTTELSRSLAEFLTDDRKGVLRKEGGIISLVDLWQVFNRTRNGIELVSPSDFEKAAGMWDVLKMPIRLRRFKSGLLVVQERNRTDAKTVESLLTWLRMPLSSFSTPDPASIGQIQTELGFGRGVTAQETAERFGWSIGVATEELEMAEELGALCRDQCLDGTRFWENFITRDIFSP